ncbi:hypothetical protein M0D69_02835 [Caballeronia sp. SEWSISQ10-4 2]|uniref:hypothetical protein n=1 Tax=Caballeronia sp. SEWSISQ10-4 2 TaxID=2937438 RepID=UPI00264E3751|nr:hypothetical protein [Caballeronia sp. SEWSISQ10-4 2]MDN7176970.1 hypothetical protein [Caballeronia sp. SEWSISQ10-4 2]
MHNAVAYLNVIGIVAGFIGGLMTFVYGLPNIDVLDSGAYSATEETDAIRRYKLLSKVGLSLISIGFLLQLPSAIYTINH